MSKKEKGAFATTVFLIP
uniref:Uncharacterized protein n=1 Tax=Lepeophtheirus salmonis TaxID=72036 RepID=A0A0K2UJ24_LEPSM